MHNRDFGEEGGNTSAFHHAYNNKIYAGVPLNTWDKYILLEQDKVKLTASCLNVLLWYAKLWSTLVRKVMAGHPG